MKVLCVCSRGNSRSAGLAALLRENYGVETLACGIHSASPETFRMLCDWADFVVVMQWSLLASLPSDCRYSGKVNLCEVGDDVYWRGIPAALAHKCDDFVRKAWPDLKPVGAFWGRSA